MIEFDFSFILYMIFSLSNSFTKKLHRTVFPTYYLPITEISSGMSSNLQQTITVAEPVPEAPAGETPMFCRP